MSEAETGLLAALRALDNGIHRSIVGQLKTVESASFGASGSGHGLSSSALSASSGRSV
jgi:hypothetical protein